MNILKPYFGYKDIINELIFYVITALLLLMFPTYAMILIPFIIFRMIYLLYPENDKISLSYGIWYFSVGAYLILIEGIADLADIPNLRTASTIGCILGSIIIGFIFGKKQITSSSQFNKKYTNYLETGHYGLDIDDLDVVKFLDKVFARRLTKRKNFKYQQIKTKFSGVRFYSDTTKDWERNEIEKHIKLILSNKKK